MAAQPHARLDRRLLTAGCAGMFGFLWLGAATVLGIQHGVITGFALTGLMVAAGCLRDWRHERGLWLLAAAIGALGSSFSALCLVVVLQVVFQGRPMHWPLILDWVAAGLVLATTIGLCAEVFAFNRRACGRRIPLWRSR